MMKKQVQTNTVNGTKQIEKSNCKKQQNQPKTILLVSGPNFNIKFPPKVSIYYRLNSWECVKRAGCRLLDAQKSPNRKQFSWDRHPMCFFLPTHSHTRLYSPTNNLITKHLSPHTHPTVNTSTSELGSRLADIATNRTVWPQDAAPSTMFVNGNWSMKMFV